MLIEAMTEKHAKEVVNMMRDFYASSAVLTNGSEEIFQNDVTNCINDNPYLEGYVFTENDTVLGYAMAAKSFSTEYGKPCIWIEDLYFNPAYCGKGYGSQFLSFITQKYADAILRLEVEEENTHAVNAYRKNGFEVMAYMEMKK